MMITFLILSEKMCLHKIEDNKPGYQNLISRLQLNELPDDLTDLTLINKRITDEDLIFLIQYIGERDFPLKRLDLNDNLLTKIPHFLFLATLETLSLGLNRFQTISFFPSLPNLKTLYLEDNQLTKICDLHLPNLNVLEIQDNKLTEIPDFHLPNLRKLRLEDNRLTTVPPFSNCLLLEIIYLDDNEISQFPCFSHLKDLNFLSISGNRWSQIPDSFLLIPNLWLRGENDFTNDYRLIGKDQWFEPNMIKILAKLVLKHGFQFYRDVEPAL